MATAHTVQVFGLPEGWRPPTKKQHHETEWLEWELPKKVEKAATKFIKQELKKFYQQCKCDSCKLLRTKK